MQVKYISAVALSLIAGAFLHHQYIAAHTHVQVLPAAAEYVQTYIYEAAQQEEPAETKESGTAAGQPDKPAEPETSGTGADLSTELELLALVVEAEAGNQSLYGKQLVVDVILNRADSPDFPDSITKVILQPRHFSTIWDGSAYRAEPTPETYAAIKTELLHRCNSEILFFTSEGFSENGTPWQKVGGHYFSTQ